MYWNKLLISVQEYIESIPAFDRHLIQQTIFHRFAGQARINQEQLISHMPTFQISTELFQQFGARHGRLSLSYRFQNSTSRFLY